MLIFLIILTFGLIYEIESGALNWTQQMQHSGQLFALKCSLGEINDILFYCYSMGHIDIDRYSDWDDLLLPEIYLIILWVISFAYLIGIYIVLNRKTVATPLTLLLY